LSQSAPTASSPRRSLHRPAVLVVVSQHVEDAAALRSTRAVLVRAPHVELERLSRLDERIAAHLDGIAVAGDDGVALCHQALSPPSTGAVFTVIVRAIETHDAERLRKLLTIAHAVPECRRGVLSAFGWVSAASLRGITKSLLESPEPWWREVGLAACAMHRVDPGAAMLQKTLDDAVHPSLTARALRVACALGRIELRTACADAACANGDALTTFEAARAAALLGDRSAGITALHKLASSPGEARDAALDLLLKVTAPKDSLALLKALNAEPEAMRTLIRAIGVAGDPHYIPWLIARMDDLKLTRLAGESFSLITGLDLAFLDLDRKPPENVAFGPNDDPFGENVAIDEDDSLPWPDPQKIAAWWRANSARFAAGTRYFMGQPPTAVHCFSVLRTGFQRQRRHAAEYLCLLKPGTPLFNIAAPAWRQQRLLAQMSVTDHTP